MTEWNRTSAYYQAVLPRVFEVHRHARGLAELPKANVPDNLRETLLKPLDALQRQFNRLRNNEFRIVVVGLEKAGKSTFINAWLGADLLPNEQKRCTFTPTQIYSVQHDSEQRLEVYPRTAEQFEQLIRDLEERAKQTDEAGQRARADLDTIHRHRASLDSVILGGNQKIGFTRIEDIAQPLRKYVADERHAHAVAEVRLYTSRLAAAEGVVFYDLPGLNSGLAKHIEDSEEMLKDCDAVILIQRSKQPSLDAFEQKLIQFVRDGDEVVGIARKLFVFFGRIDEQGTREALEAARKEALRDWHTRCQLPEDRLIPGSAAAYLLFINRAGKTLEQDTGGLGIVRANLERITGVKDEQGLRRATGIPVIRDKVNHYLQHERVEVLHRRCRGPIDTILSTAREILHKVRQRFPEDPDEARKAEENHRNIELSRWWEDHWDSILAELNRFFQDQFLDTSQKKESKGERAIDRFRERYRELIDKELKTLLYRKEDKVKELIDAYSPNANPNPIRFNLLWRDKLYADMQRVIEKVSRQLAIELKSDCDLLINKMSDLLWDSKEVARRLLDERPHLQQELEGKLRTLFLRFARPLVSIIVKSPLASVNREALLKKLGVDVELLDNYYPDKGEPAYRQLKLWARYGARLLSDKALRERILGVVEPRDKSPKPQSAEKPTESRTNEEVLKEVQADLEAVRVYLLDAVYPAAGFEAFYEEELRGLCEWFVFEKAAWAGVARNEYFAGNPRLLEKLPPHLRQLSYDTEVSERLRQLRISLEAAEKALIDGI